MKELTSRLRKELQQNMNVQIMATKTWDLPVHAIEVAYKTVLKTKMDLLMKMMLIAFQKAEIRTPEALSEILLVEQLFIEDLLNRMMNAGMVVKEEHVYTLTAAGSMQLSVGIFEHEPEDATAEVLYSPIHQSFINGDIETLKNATEQKYRYLTDFKEWRIDQLEKAALFDELKSKGIEKQEGNVQTVVSKIVSATITDGVEIPFIEFHLYNKEEDIMYARVWNTLSNEWDDIVEAQLNEKERTTWREQYLNTEA